MNKLRTVLLSIGIVGVFLFGTLLTFTYHTPQAVEESAKDFVKAQIAKEIEKKFEASRLSSVKDKAMLMAEKLGYEQDQIQFALKEKLPEKIAAVIAKMCGHDCEKEKAVAASVAGGLVSRIANIKIAQDTLGDIIRGKYLEIIGKIKLDLRIFLGSNFVMFGILLAVAVVKPKAVRHLYIPAILLLLSTIICSGLYIFGQNWFYTIIYNKYWGMWYLAYIGIVFGFFMDIIFMKGRITTEILVAFFEAIGSAATDFSCG